MPDDRQPLRVGRYLLARELFELGYARGCGPGGCSATCCKRGAYVDLEERDRILAHKDLVKAHMDESQSREDALWFEQDEKSDADFPSGKCVGTSEINDKCVFLDRGGRCSLQTAANADGLHKWALKPTYCILFPIDVADNVVRFDFKLQDQRTCCSVATNFDVPVFEACRDELMHLLGENGFKAVAERARDACGGPKPPETAVKTLQPAQLDGKREG
jgi:hypothetical protein